MAKSRRFGKTSAGVTAPISKVEITEETLSGRGGLTLFSRYIRHIGIFEPLERLFGPLRKSGKGLPVVALFEEIGIGYVCSGKLLDDITDRARATGPSQWSDYDNGRQLWQYIEFGDRRTTWPRTEWRRAFYTRPAYDDEQRLLEFARPDHVIYTNLGQGGRIDTLLDAAGHADWTQPERIIEVHHGRGRDELVHRALKDFRAEQLPFKRFQSNAAFYYTVLVAFFLFESFKRDVTADVVPITSQATRLRRQAIDFAAKIVRTSGEIILKVTRAVWQRLRIPDLWERAANPPPFAWTAST